MPKFNEDMLGPESLKLDLKNPRMPDEELQTEAEVIQLLDESAALNELLDSIASSGWLDYEPLIVVSNEDSPEHLTVVEGNRRLAALRLLNDPDLAHSLKIKLPASISEDAHPKEVKVWLVANRDDARDFIGFKHINGAFKWDSFAKAKYAADWLAADPDIAAISRRLGDSHNTVVRLVNGYKVLKQSERQGFERKRLKGKFAFSHLYTGITRPAIRDFIGLSDTGGLLPDNPVPPEFADNLYQLMVWLYGQDDVVAAVRSQNPDLKRLAEVLKSGTATAMLRAESNLGAAYETVEDKPARFSSELFSLLNQAKTVSSLIGNYAGDPDLLEIAASALRTVRGIYGSMSEESKESSVSKSEQ